MSKVERFMIVNATGVTIAYMVYSIWYAVCIMVCSIWYAVCSMVYIIWYAVRRMLDVAKWCVWKGVLLSTAWWHIMVCGVTLLCGAWYVECCMGCV